MFKPIIPAIPNPFAYLDNLSQYYKRQTQAQPFPTFAQSKPFQPHIPALKAYGPFAQAQAAPKATNPTAGPVNATPTTSTVNTPTSPLPPQPTLQASGIEPYKLDLSQARINNTLRQVPDNLKEAWNALGQDWWSQFSTWQQSYVNSFLEKYAAGDFAGANDVARSWYDKKDQYARQNGSAEQQQADQDYWDQQSQYRMSGYIG